MSAPNYHSFLICFHPGHTDVYRNGLPLGVITNNAFNVHKTILGDGREFVADIPDNLTALVREVLDKVDKTQKPKCPLNQANQIS